MLKLIGVIVAVVILAAPLAAKAEQAGKSYRIGWPASDSPSSSSHYLEAFRQGLRELGYVEGQNIALEGRWAEVNLIGSPT